MHALAAIAVIFGTALLAVVLARLVRAPSIIGFLAAGVIIGPTGFDLIHEDEVRGFAELGLIMLLFTVGLELSPAPLIQMGPRLIIATLAQMAVTAAVFAWLLIQFGGLTPIAAAILGIALSPASTAIVLKQLSDRGETDSPAGLISTGILLLQDVAIILAMIVLPLFAGADDDWQSTTWRVGIALVGLITVTLLARTAMPWIIRFVLRDGGRETMTLFAVVIALAAAWASQAAGWSPALGAAIAGLLLASTDVRHQLFAEITPFRDVFNALFFVAIGLLFKWSVAVEHLAILLAATGVAMALKALVAAGSVRGVGWSARLAGVVGLGLATVSEFGFVITDLGVSKQLVPEAAIDYLIIVTLFSMAAGALLNPIARPVIDRLIRTADVLRPSSFPAAVPHAPAGRVIVVGYGLNGRNLTAVLRATKIPHVVIEMNAPLARLAREAGCETIVGDATRGSILEHAGLESARAVVVLINDQAATRRIVDQVHRVRSDIYVLARTRYVTEIEPLRRLGADMVIPEEFETSIEIFAQVLKELGIPENVIEQQITMIRAGGYGMLRGRPTDREARLEWMRLLETAVTQPFLLPPQSPFVGRTIRDTALRARTGVTIVAITRDGRPIGNPEPDLTLEANDVLVLVGRHMQLEQARQWLDPQRDRLEIESLPPAMRPVEWSLKETPRK